MGYSRHYGQDVKRGEREAIHSRIIGILTYLTQMGTQVSRMMLFLQDVPSRASNLFFAYAVRASQSIRISIAGERECPQNESALMNRYYSRGRYLRIISHLRDASRYQILIYLPICMMNPPLHPPTHRRHVWMHTIDNFATIKIHSVESPTPHSIAFSNAADPESQINEVLLDGLRRRLGRNLV